MILILALFAGCLIYWLTWIISSAWWVLAHPESRSDMTSTAAYGTALIGLFLGLGFALFLYLRLAIIR